MGGLAAKANGGEFATGALAAGVNEMLVADLYDQFEKMPEDRRDALLTMSSQLVGVLTAAVQDKDGDGSALETGGWVAKNATQYNFLNHKEVEELAEKLERCQTQVECNQIRDQFRTVSDKNRERLAQCSANGDCVAIQAEIEGGRDLMNSLSGYAAAVVYEDFYGRQVTDGNAVRQEVISEQYAAYEDFVSSSRRERAEALLKLDADPAGKAAPMKTSWRLTPT